MLCGRHQAPWPGEPRRPCGHVLGSLLACTVGRCTLTSIPEPHKADPLGFSRARGNAVTGTAAPRPVRWGTRQPAGDRRPRCYPHGPTHGVPVSHRVGVGTGVDHTRLGDCWVVRHTQRPALRMVLKPIPPLRTGCWSSNGTRCPLDSLGLATNARGGPLAVDFALPRPVVHQRLGCLGPTIG